MRVRRNPKARKIIENHPLVVTMDELKQQDWHHKLADSTLPLYVELGMGKGKFLTTAATHAPERNWIGIERVPEVLFQATKKVEPEQRNLLFFWCNIEHLEQIFQKGEVERFYLHFSDPWPKKRHQKRRLTHRQFLNMYARLLSASGDIIVKTDHDSLYHFTLEELEALHWNITAKTEDLYQSPYVDGNISTEYEEKFASKGHPIYYLQASPH